MSDELRKPTKEELKSEIARIDRSISDLLFYGGDEKILVNTDSVLRTRGGGSGLDIYDDIERDAHAGSVLDKRKRAVTAREWGLNPASKDPIDIEAAELCRSVLASLKFDQLTKDLLDAVLKGYSVVELMWTVQGPHLVPTRCIKRKSRLFVFDIDRRPRLLTKSAMLAGEALPDRKFIVHTVGGIDGSPYGLGLGNRLFWPVFFKRQNISFWLIFNDKYGSPTAKGTYPPSADVKEQQKLLGTLRSISRDAALIIPEGMVVELLQAAKAGMDGYEKLCHYLDSEISKAVLGETQTTTVGNSGGNRALGEVHNEVRMELAKDDADTLSYTLNETVIKWIIEYNFPGRKPPTLWRDFDEPEDLDVVADRDVKLRSLGWERTEESFLEVYGAGYRRITPVSPVNALETEAPPAEFAEAPGFVARFGSAVLRVLGFREGGTVEKQMERNRTAQQTIADGANELAGNWEAINGERIRSLQTLLDETGDLAQFRERLQELADQPPSEQLVESVARATFASRVAARLPKR